MNMKKSVFYFILIFMLIMIMSGVKYAFATQQYANMDATVGVNPVFVMSVNPSTINFGSVDPGTSTEERQLTVSCVTNNNNPWSVSVRVVSEFTSGTFTIPNENFNWRGSSTGSGRWNSGDGRMSTTPFTFYEASASEYITTPKVDLNMFLSIDVPQGQAAGTYSTILALTMTE